ncbi:MAG TPA: hypothetical protein VD866_02465 [Urbifossiella sp.]|nr:hypothetical protein [Urbifossiella sp.]
MNESLFADVAPAPKQPPAGRCMSAPELTNHLARGSIALALRGAPITIDSVKAERPALAEAYTKRYSTIPTYLGAGRSADGLRLWRGRVGYTPSRENAALAFRWLAANGHDLDEVAEEQGLDDKDALIAAIEALPPHESFAK